MSYPAVRVLCALAVCWLGVIMPTGRAAGTRWQTPVQTTDEANVRALVQQFFHAYQQADLAAIMLLWSEQAPDLVASKQTLQRNFEPYAQMQLTNVELRRLKLDAGQAVVRVVFEMSALDAKTNRPATGLGRQQRTLRLVKAGDAWKVWKYLSSADDLAQELAADANDEQRRARVQAEADLVTVELVQALNAQARALQDKYSYPAALSVYRFALEVAGQLNNRKVQAATLRGIAGVYSAQNNPAEALKYYNESLTLAEALGDKGEMAASLISLGNVYVAKGEYEPALNNYRRSLQLAQELDNKLRIAVAQSNIARVHLLKGETAEALALFQRSLEVFRALPSPDQVAVTLTRLADAHRVRGEYEQSLQYFAEALERAQALNLKPLVSSILFGLGVVHRFRGEYDKSLAYFQQSLAQARALNYQKQISGTLNSMGVVYRSQGDYRLALETLQASLKLAQDMSDKEGVAVALTNIGELHQAQGHYALALDFYQHSLSLARALENKRLLAGSWADIGEAYSAQGDYRGARAAYDESLKLARAYNFRAEVLGTLINLGDAAYAEGGYTQALRYYDESLRLAGELGYKEKLVSASYGAAKTYHALADDQHALASANDAAELARQIGLHDFIWSARTVAGKAYRALKQPAAARQALTEAVAGVEQLRQQVAGAEQERQRFFETRVAPYYELVALLIADNDYAGALSYAERAKGRVLLDLLHDGRVNVTKAMTDAERAQERKLHNELVSLNTQTYREQLQAQPERARVVELDTRLQQARLEYESFQTNLYARHPELEVRRGHMEPLDLKHVGNLTNLTKAALLEYVVTEHRTYLFVITHGDAAQATPALHVYKLDIGQQKLTDLVGRYRRRLALRDWSLQGLSTELYNLLLRPAAAQLPPGTTLIIAPDGPLWELPFQALQPSPGRYVIEDHALSYVPSLTVLREMINDRGRRAPDASAGATLLAMGNPALGRLPDKLAKSALPGEELTPLPEAERQVHELGRLYGLRRSKVYTGVEAREGRLKTEAGQYRIVHLATHGLLNDANPMYSQIVLAQADDNNGEDGLLEAWEIMQLDLRADMVVLSACETGRGRVGAGEGVIGLSWALFVAGAPTTVVSQWKVSSAGTTELMLEFYRNLRAAETTNTATTRQHTLTKAEAMRQAALKLLRGAKYKDPFYWAGFVVVGDAR